MGRTQRTHLVLDTWVVAALRTMAERSGRSVSEVARELLRRQLDDQDDVLERQRGAIAEVLGIVGDPAMQARDMKAVLYGARRKRR